MIEKFSPNQKMCLVMTACEANVVICLLNVLNFFVTSIGSSLMMIIIEIGVPDRWDWTVMVRGIAGEELSARCTSAHTVNIPPLGKTTLQSTFVRTLERNLLHVHTVTTVLHQKTTWSYMFAPTLVRSHLTVPTVPFVLLGRIVFKFTFVFILERSHTLVLNVHTVPLRGMH